MSPTLTATVEEMTRGNSIPQPSDTPFRADSAPQSAAPEPSSWTSKVLEMAARRMGYQHLLKLAQHRGDVNQSLADLPERMHRAADQTKLIIELVEDFRVGNYQAIPWRSLAIGAAALLYVISPLDVLPDFIAAIGTLDDLAVMALASRWMRDDLRAYCEFKGYDPDQYFASK